MSIKNIKTLFSILLPACLLVGASCNKYLNVVPDNVSTIDDAFTLRNEAEKFLFTCYAYLPHDGDIWYNPGLETGDEMWITLATEIHWQAAFRIALGQQNASNPYFNEWRGIRKGADGNTNLDHLKIWNGIRNCNIFLENLRDESKVRDISSVERSQWIGEALFLRAYYHYYMLRMYGPIPIISKNVPVDGDIESGYLVRSPVDQCVDSIAAWLDEAAALLPPVVANDNKELGRITRPIALAVKAKLLVMAASPLFNGNSDMAGLTDQGNLLFNPAYDAQKWVKAQQAAMEAIEAAEAANFSLYRYENDRFNLSAATKTQLNIRNAVTEPFNQEVVWGNSNSYFVNQSACTPPLVGNQNQDRGQFQGFLSPPIKIAKLFYTSHGVPIDEDKIFDFANYNQLRIAADTEKYNIQSGYTTARLNFDREPRFYADLGFDGSIWYMRDGNLTGSDDNTFRVEARHDQVATSNTFNNWSATGYFIKKLVNWESTTNSSAQAPAWKRYPWPEIRLADLYLLFAEAENEVNGGSALAIEYLDRVRDRAGLEGVVQSWSNYSTNPLKYTTKEGLRAIIHRERTIELIFEGQRFWDLRRWKEAPEALNQNITGWNLEGSAPADYYQETYIYSQKFIAPRDYFWPIGNYDTRRNPRLVENPGW